MPPLYLLTPSYTYRQQQTRWEMERSLSVRSCAGYDVEARCSGSLLPTGSLYFALWRFLNPDRQADVPSGAGRHERRDLRKRIKRSPPRPLETHVSEFGDLTLCGVGFVIRKFR